VLTVIIMRLLFEINALNDEPVGFSAFLNSMTAGRSFMKFGKDLCHWRLP
jgi:hypothetical protein